MCFFRCSPKREEVISRELALKSVEEINQLNIKTLGITGGEPFLQFDLMREIVEKATSYGMIPIVVTNAHWAITKDTALNKLGDLRKVGLSWIQISLDDQHQQFIPFERIANVIKAAKELNFENIKIIGSSMRNSENFKYQLFYLQEVLGINIEDIDLLDRPRVSHRYYEDYDQQRFEFAEFVNMEPHLLPKPDCLTEMMIDVNGDLYPCCNNFIGRIGNLYVNTLQDILISSRYNKYINIIRLDGPFELAAYLDKVLNTNFSEGRYSTWCELCSRVFQKDTFRDLLINQ